MGGRLSPIMANLFMENLEHEVLCSSLKVPRIFFRYVDDIFLVWDESLGSHRDFLAELNSQHPDIQLTEEQEKNQTLPFLDVLVKRPTVSADKKREKASFDIYRKPTHSAQYIHYDSAHPLKLKKNIVSCLVLRAYRLLSAFPWELSLELQYLKNTFTDGKNGYPPHIIERWFRECRDNLQRNPNLLHVKTRLQSNLIFDRSGQQIARGRIEQMRHPRSLHFLTFTMAQ